MAFSPFPSGGSSGSSGGFGSPFGGGGSVAIGGGGGSGGGLFDEIKHIGSVAVHPLGGLVSDVGTAAIGFFPGLYAIGKTAVTNPADLPKYAEGIVKQYEAYYGHDILRHLYDHPLQPILDGLTIASGGLGAAAKVGEVGGFTKLAQLGERTTLTTRSPLAIHAGEGPVIERLSSNRPISKLRQQVVNRMQKHMFAFAENGDQLKTFGVPNRVLTKIPGVGSEMKQWGKAIGNDNIRAALKNTAPMLAYEKAWNKLSKDERIALSARSMDIHPANLKAYWGDKTQNGKELTDEVQRLMLEPTSKMQNAEAEARVLSQAGAELLKHRGALSEESEIDRPGRFKQQVSDVLGHPVDTIHDDPYYIPHTTVAQWRRGSHPMEQVGGGKAEPNRLGSSKQNLGELFSQGKLDLANDVLGPEFLRRVKWLKFWGIHEGLKRGAIRMTWEELHHDNPLGVPPKGYDFLRTSVMHKASDQVRTALRQAKERNARNPNFRNAQEVQRLEQELHRYESGARPDPQHWGKQKIQFSIRGEGEHELKAKGGTAQAEPATAPASAGEIGPLYESSLVRNPTDLQDSVLSDGFTTGKLSEAATDDNGHYYLVPKAAARAATGEFTRMSDFMYQWARRPLRVWRSALLGLRPAFFVNNLVGNSLMYAMKRGGTGAIRDLFMALRESHPDRVMKQLLQDPAVPPEVRLALTREFFPELVSGGKDMVSTADLSGRFLPADRERIVRTIHDAQSPREGETRLPGTPQYRLQRDFFSEFFPEQRSGTFGTTQSPSTEGLLRGATSKGGRAWEKTTAALPNVTSKVAEEAPRRALVRSFIRSSPEFKAVYKAMPRETRSYEGAARRLMRGEGGEKLQQLVSREVDESLGNYTQLSPFERNVMRNIFPFYAWYRAILKTTLHLAIDNPLRAQLLFRLGQIGAETALNQAGLLSLPSYLQGSIPIGAGAHGTKRAIATQSLSPWATLAQLGRGTTEDLTDLGINPFVVGALVAFRDKSSGPGGTIQGVSVQELVGSMLSTLVKGLPPVAQLFPKGPSKLYPNRGAGGPFTPSHYLSSTEAWLGAPIKEYVPSVAAQKAAAGQ